MLTRFEAATKARISVRYLRKQIANGVGPAVTKIGARVLIRSDELQAWLKRMTPGDNAGRHTQ